MLLDCGANVDSRPSHLVQFARMGSIYMEHVIGISKPRVGIVNIGGRGEGQCPGEGNLSALKGMQRHQLYRKH